jgi:hypothetical protein
MTPGSFVRVLRVGLRQGHRHVEVGAPRLEGSGEDVGVEARVGRVHDHVRACVARSADERIGVRGVDPRGREAIGLGQVAHPVLGAREIDVHKRHSLEEASVLRHGGDCRSDPAGTDDQDVHCVRASTIRRRTARGRMRIPTVERPGD